MKKNSRKSGDWDRGAKILEYTLNLSSILKYVPNLSKVLCQKLEIIYFSWGWIHVMTLISMSFGQWLTLEEDIFDLGRIPRLCYDRGLPLEASANLRQSYTHQLGESLWVTPGLCLSMYPLLIWLESHENHWVKTICLRHFKILDLLKLSEFFSYFFSEDSGYFFYTTINKIKENDGKAKYWKRQVTLYDIKLRRNLAF